MSKAISEFKVQYEDTCFADYFRGVGVADQQYWKGVALGVGDSERDAGEDACEMLSQGTGKDCEYEVTEDVWTAIHAEVAGLDDTSCIEEGEDDNPMDETPNVYMAIYYR